LKHFSPAAQIIVDKIEEGKEAISLDMIFPSKVKKRRLKQCLNVYSTGKSVQISQALRLHGSEHHYRIQVEKTASGIVLYCADVTDLNAVVLALKEDENKYRRLFESSLDPIFLTDDEFYIISMNPKFSDLFSFKLTKDKKLPLNKIFKNKQAYVDFSDRLNDKQQVKEFETLLITRSKKVKHCVLNCSPVLDDNKKVIFYQGVIRDITQKKRIEKDLIMAEKLSLTGKLARSIAHEVRNPLTNLRLALDQFRDEIPDEMEDAGFYTELIQRNADRINNLINDLLKSSRPKELKLSSASINEVLESTIVLLRDRLKLKDMNLELAYGVELPDVELDRDQIKIAILNLLLNAVEAMEKGKGRLTISTAKVEDEILLTIRDNGKGISEEEQHRLFEPFFTAKKEGTGLGLTTTQNIINAHQGEIEVNSKLGLGTEFIIHLPLRR
jgi:PAS domain S-box-containing protein